MFDRSYLPQANVEFAVIADTHYMIDPGDRELEFESRRHQTHRSRAALELLKQLAPDASIHMGDLVQEYPETEAYPQALSEALDQIEKIGLELRHTAGNHDVGDKPDPSMPTHPVTEEGLNHYHETFGPSWYSFDLGQHHLVVINSQILNTDLVVAEEQWAWLVSDLEAAAGKRIGLFLHLPLYLYRPDDTAFGNYDVIEEPARGQILSLIAKHQIELVCAAHVHFSFFDELEGTRHYIMPSPAFTRPGFSHLFTSAAPPEHGRDDTPKLAFYLFRSGDGFLDQHTIRTSGETENGDGQRVLTRTARALPDARLGVTLTHTPTPKGQVPLAYPSIVRQTVRNDYPLMTCREMGLRHLRLPVEDVQDGFQNERLQILRQEGVELTGILTARTPEQVTDAGATMADRLDGLEIQVAKADLNRFQEPIATPLPTSLAQVDPSERVTLKQHLRTRVGFRVSDVPINHPFDRTVVSIAAWESPADLKALVDQGATAIDVSLDLIDDDDANAVRVAEASLIVACLPGARVFCQPYLDLDRTMDVSNGFLDPLCNPRPVVSVYRMLNTLLFANDARWTLEEATSLTIRSAEKQLTLLGSPQDQATYYDLVKGRRHGSAKVAGSLYLREVSV